MFDQQTNLNEISPIDQLMIEVCGVDSIDDLPPDVRDTAVIKLASEKSDSESSKSVIATDGSSPDYYYAFPITDDDIARIMDSSSKYEPADALSTIERFSYDADDLTGKPFEYKVVRHHLVIANVILNLHGIIAPRFRNMRKPPSLIKKPKYSFDDMDLSNDRQVIDMHWIYCQKMLTNVITGHKSLFNRDKPFDWEKASYFSAAAGKVERKAGLIGLSEFDEMQLSSLISTPTKTRWRTIDNALERDTRKLRDYISKPQCKLHDDIKENFLSIHKAIMFGKDQPALASKAYKLMTGRNLSPKQMQRYSVIIKTALS